MDEEKEKKGARSRNLFQAFVMLFCVAGTVGLAAAIALFTKYYFDNEQYIEGRAVVLTGVEAPKDNAAPNVVDTWLNQYEKATPGCLCALGRSRKTKTDQAMLLCVGFMKKRGGAVCEMKPEKLPPGVTMNVSPHVRLNKHQKLMFLLSRFLSVRIVASRTGQ